MQNNERKEEEKAKYGLSVVAVHPGTQQSSRAVVENNIPVSSCNTDFMQILSVKLQLFQLIKGLNWNLSALFDSLK